MQSIFGNEQYIMWAVLAVYMVLITIAGSYYSKYMKTADAYFRGNNAIPWWAAGISIYVAHFTAYTFVAIASLVYIDGLAGLLLETGPALVYFTVAIFFAHLWHRLNLTSPPEYLEARFNPLTRQVFSGFGILTTFVASGTRLYAMSKLAEILMGVPLVWMIIITGSVILIYTILGGLWAVTVTDVVQFIILYLAVIPLFVIAVASIFIDSSWSEFVAKIPESYGSFPHPDHGRTMGWLLVFWFSYFLDLGGDWGTIQRLCCTPTEKDARKAALLAAAFSVPHAVLLLGPVFIGRVLYQNEIADPNVVGEAEQVYGKIALKLLPVGMVGVVIAAMFSATMSTLSVAWSVRSTSFVNDLYVRVLRPNAGDKEKILAGRAAVFVIGLIAIAVAVIVAITETGLFALAQDLIGLIIVPIILPLLLGLLIKRVQSWAALAGMITGFLVALMNRLAFRWFGLAEPLVFEYEIVVSSLCVLLVMYGSGFLPRSETDIQRSEAFFDRMKTPRPHPGTSNIPPPVGVIGTFTILIGFLVMFLVLLPQSGLNRAVTAVAALILVGFGMLMRLFRRPADLPVTGKDLSETPSSENLIE